LKGKVIESQNFTTHSQSVEIKIVKNFDFRIFDLRPYPLLTGPGLLQRTLIAIALN